MVDPNLFPHHPCLLARADNPLRCANVHASTMERCARCRECMGNLFWDALHNGDRSLALTLIPQHLRDRGFVLESYEGTDHAPVLELAQTVPPSDDSGIERFIVPEEDDGRFELLIVTEDDVSHSIHQLTLEETVKSSTGDDNLPNSIHGEERNGSISTP